MTVCEKSNVWKCQPTHLPAMLNNLTSMADFLRWPDEEDLNGAATALMRLQDTYNLDTSQLARGQILGKKRAYRELTGRPHSYS